MFEISDIIYNILFTHPALNAIVGEKIFPLVADQKVKTPFITFSISEGPRLTKNSLTPFTIVINGFDKTFTDSVLLSKQIKNAIEQAEEYFTYNGADSDYLDEKTFLVRHEFKLMFPGSLIEGSPVLEIE